MITACGAELLVVFPSVLIDIRQFKERCAGGVFGAFHCCCDLRAPMKSRLLKSRETRGRSAGTLARSPAEPTLFELSHAASWPLADLIRHLPNCHGFARPVRSLVFSSVAQSRRNPLSSWPFLPYINGSSTGLLGRRFELACQLVRRATSLHQLDIGRS